MHGWQASGFERADTFQRTQDDEAGQDLTLHLPALR